MNLLESIPTRKHQFEAYRFAVKNREFLEQQGIDTEGVVELMVLLNTRNVTESLKELLNKSFRQRLNQKKTKVTRFSDGSYPVFYGALEKETAKAEITYNMPKYLKYSGGLKKVFYLLFSCSFEKCVKDPRPKSSD